MEKHRASTPKFDRYVRDMVTELRDTRLLAKMSCGDLTALDAVYHKKCLTALYTHNISLSMKNEASTRDDLTHESLALAELMSYMEDRQEAEHPMGSMFKLSNLVKLYTERITQLGADVSSRVISSRLKEKHASSRSQQNNYEVILTFKKDIGDALLLTTKQDPDNDAVVLMRAAQIVRNQILQMNYTFNGSLDDDQYKTLPQSLVALVQMILGGTNIKNQHDNSSDIKGAVSSLTQLLIFNSIKRGGTETTGMRHHHDRETVLTLYMGILLHAKTRKRELADELFSNGFPFHMTVSCS